MANNGERHGAVLARFAAFYEEVANLKLAIREGRAALELGGGQEGLAVSPQELAYLVSQRLKLRLQEQRKDVELTGTQAEIDNYRIAQYAMAALADELLILNVDWPGREAWEPYLLEYALFQSRCAGRDFFTRLDALLCARAVGPAEEELAAVFLMCLRLGFEGQYRGEQGEQRLKNYNASLLRFIGTTRTDHQALFQQAYQHRIAGTADERMAPLSRWYKLGALGLAVYLVISTAVWVALTGRLANALAGS
jgi:type VI secretion system protein ImpK